MNPTISNNILSGVIQFMSNILSGNHLLHSEGLFWATGNIRNRNIATGQTISFDTHISCIDHIARDAIPVEQLCIE
jgi:hypothetical protein